MFGLDERIATFSNGTTVLVVIAVAVALGLRHASDPDHLAAVTTLIASGQECAVRSAARLGLVWGLGHGTSLFAFGVPIVLYRAYLPAAVQRDAETAVGAMIVVLALALLQRWRRGRFHVPVHAHDGDRHSHGARTPLQAYAIGLVHGIGGSAGRRGRALARRDPKSPARGRLSRPLRALHRRLDVAAFERLRADARAPRGAALVREARARRRRGEPRVRDLVRARRPERRAVRVLAVVLVPETVPYSPPLIAPDPNGRTRP
jgi:ABC-type nickel/cobalt efflux system permease component RcnA